MFPQITAIHAEFAEGMVEKKSGLPAPVAGNRHPLYRIYKRSFSLLLY